MADPIVTLFCENCRKPCRARICGVEGFIGSDCCEGYLLRRLTDRELEDIYADLDADEPRSAAENARLKVMGGV
jgi:hypothetical protein